MRRAIGFWAVVSVVGGAGAIGCASDPPAADTNTDETRGGAGAGVAGTSPAMGTSGTGGSGTPAGAGAAAPGGAGTAGGEVPGAAGTGPSAMAGAGGGGGDAPGAIDCAALPLPENADDVISTFEDGTGNVMQVAGRGGGFYMFNDGTGTQMPPTEVLPDATPVDRCGSMFALCTQGSGFTMWGAGMGTDFGPTAEGEDGMPVKTAYDASQYQGVQFWAKANPGSAVAVRVSLKDKNTAPEGEVCDAASDSGPEACNDDWGKALNLTTEWKPYTIPFGELRQAGWGKAFPAFDAMNVYSIQFQVNQGLDFDLCIDDLAFTR